MLRRIKIGILAILVLYTLPVHVIAQNPILPVGTYIADPSARVWNDGKIYIYGSRDESVDYYCSYDHYVISSHDLIHWDIQKDAFHSRGDLDEVPYNDDLLWAPDCAFKDGKYYLYYCQPDMKNPEGVAISTSPNGPFKNAKALNIGKHTQIDPAVFIDDDGQAYYLWGQFSMKMAKMNPDMTSLDESSIRDNIITEDGHFFHEGAFMAKRNGMYYLVYADISRAGRPTSIGYATSKTPFGPYKYGGVIIDNDNSDPAVWNNHGSIVEFKGKWYVLYHRSSHGTVMMRRTCIEPITFNDDGSIPEVEMTSQGAGKPLDIYSDIEVERACLLHGNAQFQLWNPNNEELAKINNNDRAIFRYVDFGNGGVKTVEFKVSPGKYLGDIAINIGKPWHQRIALVNVPARKGDEKWITVTADVSATGGVHELWLTFLGEGNELFSVDKFCFKK
jgi:arabinoxylan arabinofuranohydrolase